MNLPIPALLTALLLAACGSEAEPPAAKATQQDTATVAGDAGDSTSSTSPDSQGADSSGADLASSDAEPKPECANDGDCVFKAEGNLCNGIWTCDLNLYVPVCVKPSGPVECVGYAAPPCQVTACEPKTGKCEFVPATDGAACATLCTPGGKCAAGVCTGPSKDCDDKNPCTADSCNPDDGWCKNLPVANPCDDADSCTSGDSCTGGKCMGSQLNCDDGNKCTNDGCLPKYGCLHDNNTFNCDDGNWCNGEDKCADGKCVIGKEVCDDGNPCTDDACPGPKTVCKYTPNTAACDDGKPCTAPDGCVGGSCYGPTKACPYDGGTCHAPVCGADGTCGYVNQSEGDMCTDGLMCFNPGKCKAGKCEGMTPWSPAEAAGQCDDKNACTKDSCDPKTGCVHSAIPGC